jgi:MoaA/NifB/PqqE/SkfB family radical SAM enzyme
MIANIISENTKRARYANAFLRKRMVHTNLQLLYNCNFRCRICDYWKHDHKDEPQLTVPQIEVISEKLNQIAPQIVSIGGGEPLLHPDILGVVRALARYHFPVMICNGWYVTPEKARNLWKAGMHEISISLDYASAERHDDQRGRKGAFDRAVRGLETLFKTRTQRHQRVHMISVVMDDNIDEIEKLAALAEQIGVTYLITLYSDKRGEKAFQDIPANIAEKLHQTRRDNKTFVALRGYVDGMGTAVREQGVGPCYAGKNLCNIDNEGNMGLCIDRIENSVGNILTEDIHDLIAKLQKKHEENECKSCWTSCRGCIETLMYGNDTVGNYWDIMQMTKPLGLSAIR